MGTERFEAQLEDPLYNRKEEQLPAKSLRMAKSLLYIPDDIFTSIQS